MLTKDNAPVTVDAILRYKIMDERATDALLNVENFNEMIKQVSQTTLVNNIGSSLFRELLSKRGKSTITPNPYFKSLLDGYNGNRRGYKAGNNSPRTRVRNVDEGTSRREKQAKVTYGESEIQVAQNFLDASNICSNNPVAYALM